MVEQLRREAVEGLPPDEPVTMLNLMRFRSASLDGDGSGWEAYLRYSRAAIRLIRERGGRIIWAGDVNAVALGPAPAGEWDYAALVQYPTPGAFLDMMESDAYGEADVHRVNGCAEHLILATGETYTTLAAADPPVDS